MNNSGFDIRWKQRFTNLTQAKILLDSISQAQIDKLSPVELAGWVHIFDLVFELSWKTLRDLMTYQGVGESMNFTREVLSLGLSHGFIEESTVWLEMLADRNSSTHEYDQTIAYQMVGRIQSQYTKPLDRLYQKLKNYE